MNKAITETELAEIEASCEAASPEPWHLEDGNIYSASPGYDFVAEVDYEGDCEFILMACSAVPRLAAEVRRLRATMREAVTVGRGNLSLLVRMIEGALESETRP